MLSGKLVRVRQNKNRLSPTFIAVDDPVHRESAEILIGLYATSIGRTRGEIDDEVGEFTSGQPNQLVLLGFAKLLEDRGTFEVAADVEPALVRDAVFMRAAEAHRQRQYDRVRILAEIAQSLNIPAEVVETALFADLVREQRLSAIETITIDGLLHAYNLSLVQSILLRAARVEIDITDETAERYRRLFRSARLQQLICEVTATGKSGYRIVVDGPMSLFSATQKYGLRLASFLHAVVRCKKFDLTAQVRWGAARKETTLRIDERAGLRSHRADDTSDFVPKEIELFAQSFRTRIRDWELLDAVELVPIGDSVWVPDFVLCHRATGLKVPIEILGYWRKSSLESQLKKLGDRMTGPFLIAAAESMKVDDETAGDFGDHLYRFKRTPSADEIAARANQLIGLTK